MANLILSCPICCSNTFDTKQALVDHLSHFSGKLFCPICKDFFSTISLLREHLVDTDCSFRQSEDNKSVLEQSVIESHSSSTTYDNSNKHVDSLYNDTPNMNEISEENGSEHSKLYAEITPLMTLSKESFETPSLHLLEENGHSKYTIVTHEETSDVMSDDAVITQQNTSNGTISLSPTNDYQNESVKLDPEQLISVTDKESGSETSGEVYSCNTCGVMFSSVLEHIQKYHKDQDIVVEVNESGHEDIEGLKETLDESMIPMDFVTDDVTYSSVPIEFVSVKEEESDVQTSSLKRVITDAGNIVETDVNIDTGSMITKESHSPTTIPLSSLEEEVVDKKGNMFTRRYVQIENLNNSDHGVDKSIPKAPYHQVVMKEIVTMDGGEKMKVYNCVACRIYVTELDEFKAHPCKSLKYTCAHCPVSYDNAKSLCAHMKIHKVTKPAFMKSPEVKEATPDSEGGSFKCDICTTVFPTNKSLKLHKRMHYPIKARSIDPPVEDSSEPPGEIPGKYYCTDCNKWIPVGYRAIHCDFHNNTDNFNCDICNKKFTSSSYLVMHMNVHNTEKVQLKKSDKTLPYTCLYCSRQFARPHEKVKHERIHTGEKPHSCEICGKSFRVSYCLTLHMRTHTGLRPYACHHCGKRFKAHSVYNHHLLTHSEVRAYKCPFCPKAFKTSVQLAGHKNSHTKPFSCTHCNRPFASLYAVRVHTDTHRRQNNLKFACALCGASYARSFALKDHMKQAHQQDVENTDAFEKEHLIPGKEVHVSKAMAQMEAKDSSLQAEPV